MIRIEFQKPNQTKCECCGNTTTNLTRFVYKDGNAYAVYYAGFTFGHEPKVVYALVGIGEWGEQASPADRTAFSVKIWDNEGGWAVTVTDKDESPWSHVQFLGDIKNRVDALAHPRIKDIYQITDSIVDTDKPVIEYFSGINL